MTRAPIRRRDILSLVAATIVAWVAALFVLGAMAMAAALIVGRG